MHGEYHSDNQVHVMQGLNDQVHWMQGHTKQIRDPSFKLMSIG